MDLLLALLLSFLLLVASAVRGIFIAYPLMAALLLLVAVLWRRGFALRTLLSMAWRGSQQSMSVLHILLLIGAVTALWMAAGTVPAIVYYGIQLIHPRYFIVSAFVLTSVVSLLIGTSFGTVSTIGVALMIMANGSGIDTHMVAGAIIAGAYFGDRCSPMSSSANLIAAITQTDLYSNIKAMVLTGLLPLGITCMLYLGLSIANPLQITDNSLPLELSRLFNLNGLVLLPAITILGLAVLRVDVKLSMLLSIAVAIAISLGLHHHSWLHLLQFSLFGFRPQIPTPLDAILIGGGVLSMVKVSIVVLVSTALAGVLADTKALHRVERLLANAQSRSTVFMGTTLIGTAAAAFGCTQTIAILLTQHLVQGKYKDNLNHGELAVDLENTVVVISPLIPWNIAGLVPATVLTTNAGFIPYAFYLYLIPFLYWMQLKQHQDPQ